MISNMKHDLSGSCFGLFVPWYIYIVYCCSLFFYFIN